MHSAWMRVTAAFAFAVVSSSPGATPAAAVVQAVEFPYYLYPRALWERELVWLKTIGVQTVAFSIPWNWHQTGLDYDFTGHTSPRRDLVGLTRLLRRLDMHAWIRPFPPVRGWINDGVPLGANDQRAQRAWVRQLEQLLGTQVASHGGPIAYVEGRGVLTDAGAPPTPVTVISATDPDSLARSRDVLAGVRGSLLWTNVEDALYPAGWEPNASDIFKRGAVGLGGDERPTASALRRSAALLRNWAPLLAGMQQAPAPKPVNGSLPDNVTAVQLTSAVASVVSITNAGKTPFHNDLRVLEPGSKRVLVVPDVTVPAGQSLWLPLHVSIGPRGLCRECSNFSGEEHIVYATAELLAIEYENGILAMEFAAPVAGELILQLLRRPIGPYLAAGKPTEFDWDEKTLRARLRIPANASGDHRVRIGIAIEEPDTSAFFNETRRLVIGQKNTISTAYSSEMVAKRSRLRLPEGFTATPRAKSPTEIDYEISVPADAVHGDWANLTLEADGVPLGRARVQLFRPVSIRLTQPVQIRYGAETELTADPPTAIVEPRTGTDLEISIRNNSPAIQTYRLEPSGDGLDFFPEKIEISVGAVDQRSVRLRVFATEAISGVRNWRLRVTGGATLDFTMRALLLPRGRTLAWSTDLDSDGSPEWILENQKIRAVFSLQDGGRWMELNWKESDSNFLPEQGALAGTGTVEVRPAGDALEFTGKGWKRTVKLVDNVLSIEQSNALPPDRLTPQKRGSGTLSVERPSANRAVYTIH